MLPSLSCVWSIIGSSAPAKLLGSMPLTANGQLQEPSRDGTCVNYLLSCAQHSVCPVRLTRIGPPCFHPLSLQNAIDWPAAEHALVWPGSCWCSELQYRVQSIEAKAPQSAIATTALKASIVCDSHMNGMICHPPLP